MADQGVWFKLWVSALNDPELDNLSLEDFARWVKIGTYMKEQGTRGVLSLSPPSTTLCSMFKIATFDALIDVIKRLPKVGVTIVTNEPVTVKVEFRNWLKYQGDNSLYRVRRFRHKNTPNVTLKEEKRREEKRVLNTNTTVANVTNKSVTSSNHISNELFTKFWAAYPKKVGRESAYLAFKKLAPNDSLLSQMFKTLEWQVRSDQWTKDGGQFIPNPSTWLNQRRWEDQPIVKPGDYHKSEAVRKLEAKIDHAF